MGQMLLFEIAHTARQAEAIRAAQKGDWGPANAMELEFLNDGQEAIYPHGEDVGYPNAKAFRILRCEDGLHVLWVVTEDDVEMEVCHHGGPGKFKREDCKECEGRGFRAVKDESTGKRAELFVVETDIDGRLLHEDDE